MLSMAGMRGGQDSYYLDLATEDYYLHGGEPPGRWIGQGAVEKGLTGLVHQEAFHPLFQGYAPDGRTPWVQSAGHESHRPGWDLTFSAPKSVSVLWSQADPALRRVIQDAHWEAVQKAMGYLEAEAAICRIGKGGHTEVPAKLFVATFEHGTSRALDANLHTHALVLNLGLCEDGKTRTLESRPLFQHKMAAGAAYRAELSYRLQARLGVEVERQRTWFEVRGVSKPLMEAMSTRRKEIAALLRTKGYASAEAAALAALATRQVKGHAARETLFETWRETGQQHGWARAEAHALLGRFPPETAGRDPEIEALAALHRATLQVTQHQSVFTERALLRAAFEETQAAFVGVDRIRTLVKAHLAAERQFVRLGEGGREVYYTTRDMLTVEQRMLQSVARLQRTGRSQPGSAATLDQAIRTVEQRSGQALSPEQRAALRHLTLREGRVQALSGMAGTGKTLLLHAVREVWEQAGYRVLGAALAGKAAQGLQNGTGIRSETLAKTFRDLEASPGRRPRLTLDGRTVLVVDEAGMVGTRQMARLLDAVERSGARLILVGDARQLQPIEAGGPFKALAAQVGAATLTQIRRQRDAWARQAVRDFAEGDAPAALRAYAERGLLSVAEDQEQARQNLIADWKERGCTQARDTLILTSTNYEAVILNRMAQAAREQAGLLGSRKVALHAVTLSTGDRVLFTQNSRLYRVKNGSLGTVETVDPVRNTLTARLDEGDRVTIPLAHYPHVTLGYAITTHKGQGVTAENAYVLVGGPMQDRELSYVQMSRTRGETRVYTDREAAGKGLTELARQMSQSRQKELALTRLQRLQESPPAPTHTHRVRL